MQSNLTRIITPEQLTEIANYISSKDGFKFGQRSLNELAVLIRNSDPYNMPTNKPEILEFFYQKFINRNLPSSKPYNVLTEKMNRTYGFDPTDYLKSYQDKEFRSLSSKESPMAYTANNNREGRTALWTNVTPYELTMEPEKLDPLEKLNTTLEKICNYFSPPSIDVAPKNTTTSWVTYNSISLNSRQFLLDSRFRDLGDPARYKWTLNISANPGATGTVRSQDILQTKLLRGYKLSLPYCDPLQIITRSLTICIRQFSANGYSSDLLKNNNEGLWRNFNLSYFIDSYDGTRLIASPNPATFSFDLPLPTFSEFNIEFYYPNGTFCIPLDYISAAVTIGITTTFTYPNHGLNPGDLVYITNFASNDPATDNAMNAYNGLVVLLVPNPNDFTVNINTAALLTFTPFANVYIAKYRFVLGLEMLCLG